MKAFHGDQAIKDKYLARVRAHAAADEIIQGVYWEKGKGCAVGCTVHSGEHGAYETELGIPRILARLEDRIFEGMAPADAKAWPERFLSAIHVGADLSGVWDRFLLWLLEDPEHGTKRLCSPQGQEATDVVIQLFRRQIAGDRPSRQDWVLARDGAYKALRGYAAAAAYADAAAAAYAYADAAAAAYADAAAAAYARRKHFKRMADKLIELLEEQK